MFNWKARTVRMGQVMPTRRDGPLRRYQSMPRVSCLSGQWWLSGNRQHVLRYQRPVKELNRAGPRRDQSSLLSKSSAIFFILLRRLIPLQEERVLSNTLQSPTRRFRLSWLIRHRATYLKGQQLWKEPQSNKILQTAVQRPKATMTSNSPKDI